MAKTNAASFIKTTLPQVQYANWGKGLSDAFLNAFETNYQRKRQDQMDAINIASKTQQMELLEQTAPLDIKSSQLGLRRSELELGQLEKDVDEENDFYNNGADPFVKGGANDYFRALDKYDAVRRPGDNTTSKGKPAGTELDGMDLPEPLKPFEGDFIKFGRENNVDPKALAAISIHETGKGTSNAFRNKNNLMGVSNASGPISFDDPTESIRKMASLLGSRKSGPYKAAETLSEIGSIYAPTGAGNDPRGLNSSWASGVSNYYTSLGGDPNAPIKL